MKIARGASNYWYIRASETAVQANAVHFCRFGTLLSTLPLGLGGQVVQLTCIYDHACHSMLGVPPPGGQTRSFRLR
jgi:hypothetical protein